MRWVRRSTDEQRAAAIAAETGVHPVAARILVSRGVRTAVEVDRFLRNPLTELPDPFGMKGMHAAVDRICRAVAGREKIVVYGDYDVDGVTSTVSLERFLREVGAEVAHYVPHRLAEGYGMNPQAVDRLAQEGARLIVTVDCGVTAVEEVDRAARAGVDVVVVDHHKAPPELPRAVAMLNPHQPGCDFPGRELSAAGVVFFLLMALRKKLRESGGFAGRPEPNLKGWLDLVALGTIADVVPLTGVNRILVSHGLRELELARRPGVAALKHVAGIEPGPVAAGQVGFKLGPRINAAGRLDDAAAAVELLLTDDGRRAEDLARMLDTANQERQALERTITAQAAQMAASRADKVRGLVVAREGWHPGVVGIVASRLVERFHRPAVVVGVDGQAARGSCRSVEKFDMYAGLTRCAQHLVRFGGHHHAAGVHLDPARIADFTRAFEEEAARQLAPEDLEPVLRVDADIDAREATLGLATELARLGPFGAGNPEPVLCARAAGLEGRVLPAKNGGPDHLKFLLGQTDCIAFGQAERRELFRGPVRLAMQLGVDVWNGRARVQARVKDIAGAQA